MTHNIDPTKILDQIDALTTNAIGIDNQFINAYAIKLSSLSQRAEWQLEHGTSPENAARESQKYY